MSTTCVPHCRSCTTHSDVVGLLFRKMKQKEEEEKQKSTMDTKEPSVFVAVKYTWYIIRPWRRACTGSDATRLFVDGFFKTSLARKTIAGANVSCLPPPPPPPRLRKAIKNRKQNKIRRQKSHATQKCKKCRDRAWGT